VLPATASIPALARIDDDADVILVPLKMGGLTVWASLPEPWLWDAAARGESVTALLGFGPGEAADDFSGYYSVRPPASGLASRRRLGRRGTVARVAGRAGAPGSPWPRGRNEPRAGTGRLRVFGGGRVGQ
jgi:hypothetical protein